MSRPTSGTEVSVTNHPFACTAPRDKPLHNRPSHLSIDPHEESRSKGLDIFIMRFMMRARGGTRMRPPLDADVDEEGKALSASITERIRVIDTDTHLVEPPDLWTSRMSSRWGD